MRGGIHAVDKRLCSCSRMRLCSSSPAGSAVDVANDDDDDDEGRVSLPPVRRATSRDAIHPDGRNRDPGELDKPPTFRPKTSTRTRR